MSIQSTYTPYRSPIDTDAGDLAFDWATEALQTLAREAAARGEGPQAVGVRSLAETAVLESLGLAPDDAEAIVTEVERRIEGLFRLVGTA